MKAVGKRYAAFMDIYQLDREGNLGMVAKGAPVTELRRIIAETLKPAMSQPRNGDERGDGGGNDGNADGHE